MAHISSTHIVTWCMGGTWYLVGTYRYLDDTYRYLCGSYRFLDGTYKYLILLTLHNFTVPYGRTASTSYNMRHCYKIEKYIIIWNNCYKETNHAILTI